MHYLGIDIHKKESQICILSQDGSVYGELRIATSVEKFTAVLAEFAGSRVLLESGTESEWIAQHLESLGLEVLVADPNFAPMYAERQKKIKTDKRDARALAYACIKGVYRPAHRLSPKQRQHRAFLQVRQALVSAYTLGVNVVRTQVRAVGLRVPGRAQGGGFVQRVRKLLLPPWLLQTLEPMLEHLTTLTRKRKELDAQAEQLVKADDHATLCCTAPGVGPITALAFVSVIDQPSRFAGAHKVNSYLGLVPREYSSSENQRKGSVTKAGSSYARAMLVQAALCLKRDRSEATKALRDWAERIGARRGKRKATVALARRLSGILWAMMRDAAAYQATPVPRATVRKAA